MIGASIDLADKTRLFSLIAADGKPNDSFKT